MGLILVSPLFEEFLSFLYDSKISQKVPKIYLLTPVVSFEMMNEEFFFLMFGSISSILQYFRELENQKLSTRKENPLMGSNQW